MRREEDGDDRVMADICQGEVGANADTWEDGHLRTTAIIAARMRVACTRTFCSTLCAEISFRLLTLQIRARGYLSALSTIVIIACVVAAAALVRFALTAKCSHLSSLIAHCSHCSFKVDVLPVFASLVQVDQSTSEPTCKLLNHSTFVAITYIHGIGTTKTATASATCEASPFFT